MLAYLIRSNGFRNFRLFCPHAAPPTCINMTTKNNFNIILRKYNIHVHIYNQEFVSISASFVYLPCFQFSDLFN